MRVLALALVVVAIALPALPALADPGGDPSENIDSQARVLYDQGMEHFRRKQWTLAIQSYLQAIRLESRFPEAWNNLGYCYRKVKDDQKALEAYRRALELRPDFAAAHEYIGRLYVALGNREMAMRHYEILRRLDAKLAAELLSAIERNESEYGE
jgi:tetratricopeptide (TPR) repeat protein